VKKASLSLLLFLFFGFKTAHATTIVPFLHLGELAQNSDAVLVLNAREQTASKKDAFVYADFKFDVERAIKGPFSPGDAVVVRPFSNKGLEISTYIHGDFRPQAGKTYLLFLNRHHDHWKVGTMSYYALEEKTLGDERYWVPVDAALTFRRAPRPDGQTAEPLGVYRRSELLSILDAYVQKPEAGWDVSAARTAFVTKDFVRERSIPTGCDFTLGTGVARWFNDAVNIYYDPADAVTDAATLVSAAVNTLSSNYPGIAPFYAGSLSYTNLCTGGTAVSDALRLFLLGTNSGQSTLVMFNDPCNEIANLTVNPSGNCFGTLAFGGSWAYTPTALYDGQQWQRSGQGFVVLNENVTTCNNVNVNQLLTHELTHMYSMGHLDAGDYPGQNMNPLCCNPIGAKDIVCMNHTYLSPLPVELTRFDAEKWRDRQARLRWATASEKNNDHFFVERSVDGLRFERVALVKGKNTAEGAQYEWIDARPFPGQNYYRLHQVDFDGSAHNCGIRAVRIGDARSGLEVYPNPLTADVVKMITAFETAYEGQIEIADASGRLLERRAVQLERGDQITEISVPALPPGVYWLRLNNGLNTAVQKFVKP
jgi:Secretion system C-terminal sorting domain